MTEISSLSHVYEVMLEYRYAVRAAYDCFCGKYDERWAQGLVTSVERVVHVRFTALVWQLEQTMYLFKLASLDGDDGFAYALAERAVEGTYVLERLFRMLGWVSGDGED